jgi:hypothetical protein
MIACSDLNNTKWFPSLIIYMFMGVVHFMSVLLLIFLVMVRMCFLILKMNVCAGVGVVHRYHITRVLYTMVKFIHRYIY